MMDLKRMMINKMSFVIVYLNVSNLSVQQIKAYGSF